MLNLKPYTELGRRQQKRRRSQGERALAAISGPEGIAELAADIAKDATPKLSIVTRTPTPSPTRAPSSRAAVLEENVERLFASLPPHSPIRRGLVGELVEGLPVQEAADLAGCSPRTVERARQERKEDKDNGHLLAKYQAHVKRQKISAEERKATEKWLDEKCPVKSGTRYHIQRCTSLQLYEEYRAAISRGELSWRTMNGAAPEARSRSIFDRMKKKMGIRAARGYDGNFDCLLCKAIPEEVKNQATIQGQWEAAVARDDGSAPPLWVELEAVKARVVKLRDHEALRKHQALSNSFNSHS